MDFLSSNLRLCWSPMFASRSGTPPWRGTDTRVDGPSLLHLNLKLIGIMTRREVKAAVIAYDSQETEWGPLLLPPGVTWAENGVGGAFTLALSPLRNATNNTSC